MNTGAYQQLSQEQVDHFLARGHVVIHDCFSAEFAEQWKALAFDRLGYDRDDSSTWVKSRIHMPAMRREEVKQIAPKAWRAMCDLLGGEDRIKQPTSWGDSFILNLRDGIDRPWEAPSARSPGWHKDGDWFRHFLDSPEQGLLVIVVWSDIGPRGGATIASPDSIAPVARFLASHPEGVLPGGFNFRSMIEECSEFVELTGRTGDVILIHPFTLHASSQNHSGIPRFITNPAVSLREPMRFDRDYPAEYSLVEQVVLRALGAPKLEFRPTHERERVVPERERIQKKMLEEQQARLAAMA